MRRVPIRLRPIQGESLDSWIVAYAGRLDTPIRDTASAIGLGKEFITQPARLVATGRRAEDLGGAMDASGLAASELENLWRPLSRYAAVAGRRFARTPLARLARPMHASRFCPGCLVDNGGRWAALWRLPWWVACPTHLCLMASTCQSCGGRQRERPIPRDTDQPQLAACSAPRKGTVGRGARCCGVDLTIVPTEAASDDVLAALRPLGHLLDAGISDDDFDLGVDHLADVLTVASVSGLIRLDPDAGGFVETTSMALALSLAQQALAEPAGEALAGLALADAGARPHPLPRPWRPAGPALTSRVLAIRDPHLRPSDRLRWRTTTTGSRPRSDAVAPDLIEAVPPALWLDWTVRLRPQHGVETSSFRLVAAAALLLPGAVDPIEKLLAGWSQNPSPRSARAVSHVLLNLSRAEQGSAVLRAITQLSDALQHHGSPIDYQRRLRLAGYAEVLDRVSWDRICAAAGTPTGGDRRLRNARLWIWETITGGLVQRAPEPIAPGEPTGLTMYYDFALRLVPAEVEQLIGHARRLLNDHECADEPVAWSPPAKWADLDGLPVFDLNSVDVDEVAYLLRRRSSPSDVAEQLGISIDHVRLVMRLHPQDLRPAPKRVNRNPVPGFLSPDRLRELIIDDGQTIRAMSRELGMSRKTLTGAVRREGLPMPPAHPPPKHEIDPAWLRTEYIDRRRTLPDLAAEVGTAPTNLARIARRHGIPLRGRGGASHESSLTAPAGFPEPLASAVLGQGGVQRVRRFQVFARTPSLNQAVTILQASQATLSVQLARLEEACGGPLLVRSPRTHRPQQLTPLGHQLLAQADEHLGRNPSATKDLPEPLASALFSFRGEDRVRRFQVAARLPTLADAAKHFGTDHSTFNRALRGLEAACGGPLLMRNTVSRPHDLTDAGRLLLGQADGHFGRPIGFARMRPTNGSQPKRTVGKDGGRAEPNLATC